MPDPISILMGEHKEALHHLMQLEHAIESMSDRGFNRDAFELLAGAIRYFGGEFRQHDRKEELLLFPLLEQYKPGITKEYRNEHRELWSAFNHLLSCVSEVEEGRLRGSTRQELIESAKHIVELLRAHMVRENTVLFIRAQQLFSDTEYRELGEKMVVPFQKINS